MNNPSSPPFVSELAGVLRGYLTLCQEAFALAAAESRALASPQEFQPFAFYQGRKALLSRLDDALHLLRPWRQAWQRLDPAERAGHSEVKQLLQAVQDSLVKILVMDRENQQALLRRGLVPARHVSSFAHASRPPHFAAQIYRRHSNPS